MSLTLEEANRIVRSALAKAQRAEHQDQRGGVRRRRSPARVSAHGRRH